MVVVVVEEMQDAKVGFEVVKPSDPRFGPNPLNAIKIRNQPTNQLSNPSPRGGAKFHIPDNSPARQNQQPMVNDTCIHLMIAEFHDRINRDGYG